MSPISTTVLNTSPRKSSHLFLFYLFIYLFIESWSCCFSCHVFFVSYLGQDEHYIFFFLSSRPTPIWTASKFFLHVCWCDLLNSFYPRSNLSTKFLQYLVLGLTVFKIFSKKYDIPGTRPRSLSYDANEHAKEAGKDKGEKRFAFRHSPSHGASRGSSSLLFALVQMRRTC